MDIADLRAFIEKTLAGMLAQNATRLDFSQRLQKVIDAVSDSANMQRFSRFGNAEGY